MNVRSLICLTFVMLITFSAKGQDEYSREVFTSSKGDRLQYRLLKPENMKADEKYPLVLFLHGAGERGDDNQKQLAHGGQMFLNPVNREKYPSFVVIPQCPEDGYWGYNERPSSFLPGNMPLAPAISGVFSTLKELLDTYLAMPQVDRDRVYIIGLSMGAMGTYDLVSRYPDIFAAAVPICGTVNPARLSKPMNVQFRIFHGDNDDVVTVEGSRAAYRALKAAGTPVEYHELPGTNHGSWNPAFNYPDFMEWIYSKRKQGR